MVSRETYEMLKAQMAKQQETIATLRAHKDSADAASRDFIKETAEDSNKFLQTLAEQASTPMQKQMIAGIQERLNGLAATPAEQLDQEMPVAVMVHCASANMKKRDLDDGTAKERAEELRKQLAKNEELEQEVQKKARQLSEVQQLAEERQAQTEELGRKLAALTGAARRYDFNIPTSRHTGLASNAAPMNATAAAAASLAASHAAAQSSDNAAKAAAEANGIPSTMSTGGNAAGKAPMTSNNVNNSGLTTTHHLASGGMANNARPTMPTADGFASWAMSMGNGGARAFVTKGLSDTLGLQDRPDASGAGGSSNSNAPGRAFGASAEIEAAIRGAMM